MAERRIINFKPQVFHFEAHNVRNHGIRHPRLFLELSTASVKGSGQELFGIPNTTTHTEQDWINYHTRISRGGSVDGTTTPSLLLVTYTVASISRFQPETFLDQIRQHLSPDEVDIYQSEFYPYQSGEKLPIIDITDFQK